MPPTIGVLITYHNERHLLTECLESLLQSAPPDEVLIYDDGSKFQAEEFIKDFPVKVIRSETNKGPSFGRNQLLKESRSDFIHFHDSDDLFEKDWLLKIRREIETKNPDAVFTEIASFKDNPSNENLISTQVLNLKSLDRDPDLLKFCLSGSLLVPSGTYRRQIVSEMGGYPENLWQSEDFYFHCRLAARNISYSMITEPLIRIRVHQASRSKNEVEVWSSYLKALEILSAELPKRCFTDISSAATRAGSKLFRLGAKDKASAAFALAARLEKPRYEDQNKMYRFLARLTGPLFAEHIAAAYRHVVPVSFRRKKIWRSS